MSVTRRDAIKRASLLTVGFLGLKDFVSRVEAVPRLRFEPSAGFGPLTDDARGLFRLPNGFMYRAFSAVGESMDDGLLVPGYHDGMGAFAGPDGTTILVRNHEIGPGALGLGAFGAINDRLDRVDVSRIYDRGPTGNPCLGGTVTIVYDTRTQHVVQQSMSLAGTALNCAGGATPWNTWITCEEVELNYPVEFARLHGYNFEVPATTRMGLVEPIPLHDMGRFKHEAIAVAPSTGIIYETEDQLESLFFRFIPNVAGDLKRGGRLQALVVIDAPGLDTRNWLNADGSPAAPVVPTSTEMAVRWMDIDAVDNPDDDLRFRGRNAGAACFARGEGIWYGNDAIYFACTEGGPRKIGQIWRYTPSPHEGRPEESQSPGRLELFLESHHDDLLKNCDNLTIAPWGDLIICEDSVGRDRIVGITPGGAQYVILENTLNDAELAGVTFSPDGSTLFANVQHPGMTIAITGPWSRRGV